MSTEQTYADRYHTSTHYRHRRTDLFPSFIAIKPDGVQRGLVGPILSRFESRGYKLVAIKLVTPSKEHLEEHYADLSEKPFFKG